MPQFRKIVCLVCACFARKRINENLFRVYLLTECAYSQTEHEPQGGEKANAELDVKYKWADEFGFFSSANE